MNIPRSAEVSFSVEAQRDDDQQDREEPDEEYYAVAQEERRSSRTEIFILEHDLEECRDGDGQGAGRHTNVSEILHGTLRVRNKFMSGKHKITRELTLRNTILVMDDPSEACPARVEDG